MKSQSQSQSQYRYNVYDVDHTMGESALCGGICHTPKMLAEAVARAVEKHADRPYGLAITIKKQKQK